MRLRPFSSTPSRKAPLSRMKRPRWRKPSIKCSHTGHEHDNSCCGAIRRRIVAGIEKFMNKLQVLNEAGRGPPHFRGHFGAPVVMAFQTDAVAGQVERGPALPVGSKHGPQPTAPAAR